MQSLKNSKADIPDPRVIPVGERLGWSARSTAVRLFFTCWLIFVIHVATNTVREIYLALSIADHLSFEVDDYAHMHPDLFDKPGYGWHIGANPGASMVAAIPYAIFKPLVDRVVSRVNASRAGIAEPPAYDSPWPMARQFYRTSWLHGYDIKFGFAAIIMQAFCMAPLSAFVAVILFYALRQVLGSDRKALLFALLYSFGTPVLFRTGYLSHNLMLGHIAFLGFFLVWNPSHSERLSMAARAFFAGLSGGLALLFDYSGSVILLLLFAYVFAVGRRSLGSWRLAVRSAVLYIAGTIGPVLLLWFYQWQSFGHFLYPGQHWMPPVQWIERGYQGFTGPQLELLMLLLFFGGVHYTRLQYNTGIRYMTAVFPFLFVPAALVLSKLPKAALYFLSVLAVAEAWCLAMHRDVERGFGLLDPILQVFIGGFRLPLLTVVSRLGGQFGEYTATGVSPLPIFILVSAVIYGIWRRGGASES